MKKYMRLSIITLGLLGMLGGGNVALAAPALESSTHITKENTNAYMEVDLQALKNNIEVAKKIAGHSKICAVLKANAYGAGIANILPTIIKEGVPCVGIASDEEARVLREGRFKGEILRIRAATIGEIKDGLKYHITELIGNLSQAKELDILAKKMHTKLPVHIALNSAGMDRNGIDLSLKVNKADAIKIASLPNLEVTGLMTHFPFDDKAKIEEGISRFKKDTDYIIKHAKLDRSKITLHAAASNAIINVPESHFDMVRPGDLIYGYGGYDVPIKPITSFKSYVTVINSYPKGSTVTYDGTYTLTRDSKLANIPVGYSDGYSRAFSNKGFVLIRGHKVPVVGRITMNTFMVDVTNYPDIKAGDSVVLYGKQCGQEIKESDLEKTSGLSFYEVLTDMGNANPAFIKSPREKDVCDVK
ncbi:alanine racemase [Helicobacter sp. 13S00401-1]|uniref:alanine racemase n=1 Tax=Helicobacter sp. 13S00401-1 TaxID=1905758 RepID=UPI000BA585A4|nr:alanine racemase [Helicobacter sp. 13S00401-1]PAF49327.1 alanine racemase [Helicobacter sp. 13S00401-1]